VQQQQCKPAVIEEDLNPNQDYAFVYISSSAFLEPPTWTIERCRVVGQILRNTLVCNTGADGIYVVCVGRAGVVVYTHTTLNQPHIYIYIIDR